MPKNPLDDTLYKSRISAKTHRVRGEYFRDQTAIIHSMPFRRLKHKTQVFFAPENDHVCTRIEHVMHVASIAAAICKGLNLENPENWNLDTELAYSIGIGHDLGHAPFGHAGETAISNKLPVGSQFEHELNSLRVIDKLANGGAGLNLTFAVRDGISCHNGESFEQKIKPSVIDRDPSTIKRRKGCIPTTYEGCIVRFADKIAYLGRDIEDAIVAGFIRMNDVDPKLQEALGQNNGEVINTLVMDLIESSKEGDEISFSDEKHALMTTLKDFNYSRIYDHPAIVRYKKFGAKIIGSLFDYLCTLYCEVGKDYDKYLDPNRIMLDIHFGKYLKKMGTFYESEAFIPQQIVTDYISGMTDDYALRVMKQISIPKPIEFSG
jgi:dGTPase